jgi:DNA-binding NtrC family response regulator
MKPLPLLILADETLRAEARRAYHELLEAGCEAEALERLLTSRPRLVVIEHSPRCPWDGAGLAAKMRRLDSEVALFLVANPGSEDLAVAALRAGVTDYLRPPVQFSKLAEECAPERAGAADQWRFVGSGPAIRALRASAACIATADSNVLITGETGTGKELFARLIHQASARRRKPFLCINCAALPDTLLESELFGHERGAFTDARSAYAGKLKLSDGGTVLLDEIGDVSLYAQAKLLRVIETKEIHRLGGAHPEQVDVRLVAATNRDLEALCRQGRFRDDLYYRLNVARLHLPPLRERLEDLPALLEYYREDLNRRLTRRVEAFSEEARACLGAYRWPGNIRELKNVLEGVFIHLKGPVVERRDLPEPLRQIDRADPAKAEEQARLLDALIRVNWNKSRAAETLHWSRMTLYRKMAKYRISLQTRMAGV